MAPAHWAAPVWTLPRGHGGKNSPGRAGLRVSRTGGLRRAPRHQIGHVLAFPGPLRRRAGSGGLQPSPMAGGATFRGAGARECRPRPSAGESRCGARPQWGFRTGLAGADHGGEYALGRDREVASAELPVTQSVRGWDAASLPANRDPLPLTGPTPLELDPPPESPPEPAHHRPFRSPRPGQEGKARPLPSPPGHLLLVDVPGGEGRIGADDQTEQVGESVGRVDAPAVILREPDADTGCGRWKGVDGRLRRGVGRTGDPEVRLIPEVHPGLVADLDRHRQAGEDLLRRLDGPVLGLPAQVAGLEVRQVVVPDALVGRPRAEDVLDRLGHATGCQVAPRQPEPAGTAQHLEENRALAEDAMEDVDLLIEGEPVGRLSGAHRPIVGRDEPAMAGLGLKASWACPTELGMARVRGAGNALSGAAGYCSYRRLTSFLISRDTGQAGVAPRRGANRHSLAGGQYPPPGASRCSRSRVGRLPKSGRARHWRPGGAGVQGHR